MSYSVLFGSYARGDYTKDSDCDVLLIDRDHIDAQNARLPTDRHIDYVEYSTELFEDFFNKGSLFLYHIFSEGILLEGNNTAWDAYKNTFEVQKNFNKELEAIYHTSHTFFPLQKFGGKYLTPLSNLFSELKNACIFHLAQQSIYEFNKARCFSLAIPSHLYNPALDQLKCFYDYTERFREMELPFSPNDAIQAESLIISGCAAIKWFSYACR